MESKQGKGEEDEKGGAASQAAASYPQAAGSANQGAGGGPRIEKVGFGIGQHHSAYASLPAPVQSQSSSSSVYHFQGPVPIPNAGGSSSGSDEFVVPGPVLVDPSPSSSSSSHSYGAIYPGGGGSGKGDGGAAGLASAATGVETALDPFDALRREYPGKRTEVKPRQKPIVTPATQLWIPFGKFDLKLNELLDKSAVVFRYSNTGLRVRDIPRFKVSDPVRSALLSLCREPHMAVGQFVARMNLSDKAVIERSLLRAHFDNPRIANLLGYNPREFTTEKKKRLLTITGEMDAHNNSDMMRTEAEDIATYLYLKKVIREPHYVHLLKILERHKKNPAGIIDSFLQSEAPGGGAGGAGIPPYSMRGERPPLPRFGSSSSASEMGGEEDDGEDGDEMMGDGDEEEDGDEGMEDSQMGGDDESTVFRPRPGLTKPVSMFNQGPGPLRPQTAIPLPIPHPQPPPPHVFAVPAPRPSTIPPFLGKKISSDSASASGASGRR